MNVNINGTHNLLSACLTWCRFNPRSAYGISKLPGFHLTRWPNFLVILAVLECGSQ